MFTFVMRNNGLTPHANFESLGGSGLLLFQVCSSLAHLYLPLALL